MTFSLGQYQTTVIIVGIQELTSSVWQSPDKSALFGLALQQPITQFKHFLYQNIKIIPTTAMISNGRPQTVFAMNGAVGKHRHAALLKLREELAVKLVQ